MASFLKWIKKHKGILIFLLICLIVMIPMILFAHSILVSGNEGTIYGNRLEGIDQVRINEDTLKKIIDDIKGKEQVENATYRLEGKILNVIIEVIKDADLENSKKLTNFILNSLNEEERGFYDIQVFLTSKEESAIYPIIGYKHRTSSEFVW